MKTISVKSAAAIAALACLAVPSSSFAKEFVLLSSDRELIANQANQGWWNSTGTATVANGNYLVGVSGGATYRNFFTFDLAHVPEGCTVDAATLLIWSPLTASVGTGGVYDLWDVTTPWYELNSNQGVAPAALWADLASGALYSTTAYAVNPPMGVMHAYPLLPAALTDLTAAIGTMWSVGGNYTPTGGTGNMYGFTSGTFRAVLELDATCEDATSTCDTASLEDQLCIITDLVLTPQGQRCTDGPMCGAGSHPRGLTAVPDPPSCGK